MKEFHIEGYHPLPNELLKRPPKRAKPSKEASQAKKQAEKEQQLKRKSKTGCKCNGGCWMHNVNFVVCLIECFPVDKVPLTMVARECVFATKDVFDMTQSEKRFLLYYYYATTVYQFRGRGNRVELPECLKSAVRALYPNDCEIEPNENEF